MVMESWLNRVGNHVTNAFRTQWKKKSSHERVVIGVLGFEIASLMSKVVHLWQSLSDKQVIRLRNEVINLDGVRKLVSDDEDFLLGLACAEILDNLAFIARSVVRLGKKCSDSALQGFEHLFEEFVKNGTDSCNWEFNLKKIERKIKKMERLISLTSNLYQELEVLSELEQTLRRMQSSNDPNKGNVYEFQQKVVWQRQEIKHLRDVSLWNRGYESTTRLLVRSVFTIFGRIKRVFGLWAPQLGFAGRINESSIRDSLPRSMSVSAYFATPPYQSDPHLPRFSSGPLGKSIMRSGPVNVGREIHAQFMNGGKHLPRKFSGPMKPFKGWVNMGNSSPMLERSPNLNSVSEMPNGDIKKEPNLGFVSNCGWFSKPGLLSSKSKLLNPPPSTLGAAALSLHYANVIIVIEKLVSSPHLIGPDARDDLYNMLPSSIRSALRVRLKSYAKNLASSVYDPGLASEWSGALSKILDLLGPLAHNMIRWHSERNFGQQHLVSKTNVLLLQTLYFANHAKTDSEITELLVGLNYLWRFERELNAKALLECMSSNGFDECLDPKANNGYNECFE
ncbi:hypothetical protein AMTRI_Chr11g149970 [Amborella trichopoda]